MKYYYELINEYYDNLQETINAMYAQPVDYIDITDQKQLSPPTAD